MLVTLVTCCMLVIVLCPIWFIVAFSGRLACEGENTRITGCMARSFWGSKGTLSSILCGLWWAAGTHPKALLSFCFSCIVAIFLWLHVCGHLFVFVDIVPGQLLACWRFPSPIRGERKDRKKTPIAAIGLGASWPRGCWRYRHYWAVEEGKGMWCSSMR